MSAPVRSVPVGIYRESLHSAFLVWWRINPFHQVLIVSFLTESAHALICLCRLNVYCPPLVFPNTYLLMTCRLRLVCFAAVFICCSFFSVDQNGITVSEQEKELAYQVSLANCYSSLNRQLIKPGSEFANGTYPVWQVTMKCLQQLQQACHLLESCGCGADYSWPENPPVFSQVDRVPD